MLKDRLKELYNKVDWRDYFEDYKINPKNKSGGVKLIPINRKSANQYTFEELLNSTPTLDLSFNVRDKDSIKDCLFLGKTVECPYRRGIIKNIIIYSFDQETNILTRSYNGTNKEYYLTDEQVVAIVKFLIDKCNEKSEKDLNNNIKNSENNNNIKKNENNDNNVKDIFDKYFKNIFNEKIEDAKARLKLTQSLNDYNLKEEIYKIWIELKQDTFIINTCKNNKVYCDKNQKDQLKELLQEYYKSLTETGTN